MSNPPIRPFVILSLPRSGTNLFLSRLGSHPRIACHNEIFNNAFTGSPDVTVLPQRIRDRIADLSFRASQPYQFAEYAAGLHPDYADCGLAASGFKMFPLHGPDVYWRLARDRRFTVFVVRRRNFLKTYASLKLAMETQQWVYHGVAGTAPTGRTVFVAQDFRRHCANYRRHFRQLLDTLRANGVRHAQVLYHNFVRDERVFQRCFAALNAGPHDQLTSEFQQQNPDNALNRFSNPGDVLAALSQQEQAIYLGDETD